MARKKAQKVESTYISVKARGLKFKSHTHTKARRGCKHQATLVYWGLCVYQPNSNFSGGEQGRELEQDRYLLWPLDVHMDAHTLTHDTCMCMYIQKRFVKGQKEGTQEKREREGRGGKTTHRNTFSAPYTPWEGQILPGTALQTPPLKG